jgi:hypothetical protein
VASRHKGGVVNKRHNGSRLQARKRSGRRKHGASGCRSYPCSFHGEKMEGVNVLK